MKTYNNFLLEDYKLRHGSKKLTKKEFMKLLKENCHEFLKNPEKSITIYKGSELSDDYYYTNPKAGYRPPSDGSYGSHFYQHFFDTAPSWKDYPKRSKSVIASGDFNQASKYGINGDIYVVIPFDNSEWAICSRADFWDSFNSHVTSRIKTFFNDVIDFYNYVFGKNIYAMPVTLDRWDVAARKISKIILDGLKKLIGHETKGLSGEVDDLDEDLDQMFRRLREDGKMNLSKDRSFYDVLNDVLSPENNGFKLKKYTDLKKSDFKMLNEIYTNSKCLYISHKNYQTLIEDLQ